jgi:Arm domain-containing DNA-binding protein
MPAHNDVVFRTAKPREKPYKLSDGGGLFLLVQPNGTKLWRLAYRFDGKQKLIAFGRYPVISLADARIKRDAAKKLLSDGVDPSFERKTERRAAQISRRNTFKAVAEELMVKFKAEGDSTATLKKKQWLLDFAIADFGNRPIAEIRAPEILMRCVKSRSAAGTKPPRGSEAPSAPSLDMRSPPVEPNVTHRPISAGL